MDPDLAFASTLNPGGELEIFNLPSFFFPEKCLVLIPPKTIQALTSGGENTVGYNVPEFLQEHIT